MKITLTDEIARATEPRPDGEMVLSDTEAKGLRLKITPAGTRTWFTQYRATDGRQKKLTFGSADEIPVRMARDLFKAAMAKVDAGRDPHGEKMETAQLVDNEPTLMQAWTLYDQRHLSRKLKPGSASEYRRVWDRDMPVALKKKHLSDVAKMADPLERRRRISRADLEDLQERMASRPGVANLLFRVLKAFFNWCEGDGQLVTPNSNPLHKMKSLRLATRHFVFSPAHLHALAKALSEEEHKGWPPAVMALRFLLMTGFRLEEALQLRWADINEERRTVLLADSKTGESTRALGAGAMAVLEQSKKFQVAFGSVYVFPSPRDRSKPLRNVKATMQRACKVAGIPYGTKNDGVWLHGLRHNFGAYGAKMTSNAVLVRDLLGHSQIGTTDGYMKAEDDSLQDAADATTDAITRDMQSNVVRIARR